MSEENLDITYEVIDKLMRNLVVKGALWHQEVTDDYLSIFAENQQQASANMIVIFDQYYSKTRKAFNKKAAKNIADANEHIT